MKLCFVAPGVMPIPPTKWGAVEMMLWDYQQVLSKIDNVDVEIINTQDKNTILNKIHSSNFDIVHIHYDVFVDLATKIYGPAVIMSSHYPYINTRSQHKNDGYDKLFMKLVDNRCFHIFASSQKDVKTFTLGGADPKKIHISHLGVRKEQYSYLTEPVYDKTFCFSQIVDRKRQSQIQCIKDVIFSGRVDDSTFKKSNNYIGELTREKLNDEITKYSNFVLLSSVENTTPLVVKEAMVCGLGVVVSEDVACELDKDLPFVTVLSEEQIMDIKTVKDAINHNKLISRHYRREIREYAISKFDMSNIIKNEYIPLLEKVRLNK